MKIKEVIKSLIPGHENIAVRFHKQHEIMSQLIERKNINSCDMQVIFEEVASASCKGLDISRVTIWLYSDDHSREFCTTSYDRQKGTQDFFDELTLDEYPEYKKALESGAIIIEDNAQQDARINGLADTKYLSNNTRALLCLPIWVDGTNIGHVNNEQSGESRTWTHEDQNFACLITHYIAIAMGNCRRNKTEQQLKESEQRYKLAVSGSNDGLWDWDISRDKIYRSPQYKKLLGYEEHEMNDAFDFWKLQLHPDDASRAKAALEAHLNDGQIIYDDEFRLRTKSGDYRWFRCRGNASRDENDIPYRVSGSIVDIDDLKYTQRSLNRFKQTLGEITENIFMFDPKTLKYFYVNKSAIDDIGYSENELFDMTPIDIQPNFDEKSFRHVLSNAIASPGKSLNYETMHQCKNGEQLTVEINLKYIDPDNSPPRFIAIVRDISERRKNDIESYIQRTILENIYKVQEGFISGADRDQVFEQMLNSILDITESDFGFIGDLNYQDGDMPSLCSRYINGVNKDVAYSEISENMDQEGIVIEDLNSLLGKVITIGDSVISNNVSSESLPIGFPAGFPVIETYMGLPLKSGDRIIGMIAIANRAVGYDDAIIQQLQPLLSTCANLLDAERAEEFRKNMEGALLSAKEEAEQANRAKSEFLSSMSHELRTPLNAIMGFAQILQLDKELSGDNKKHTSVIYNAGSLLLELINDVLDLAKIEAGKIDLSIEPILINNVINDSFEFIKPLAEKNGIRLKLENEDDSIGNDICILADNTRFKQVILNILSNAIKYNKADGTVSVCSYTTNYGMHKISITDTGRGISKDNINKLFQPFNRLEEQNGDIEGTGIGLVITRKLIELMGGTIDVESEYGQGTTFTVEIPSAEPENNIDYKNIQVMQPFTFSDKNNLRVLVAEDNQTNQQLIALQLETLGYKADVANNGRDALKMLHRNDYVLLLTDINMPEMNGYQLTKAIRTTRNNSFRNINIIAITANAASDEAKRCIEMGMNDYLTKPIDIDELQNKLLQWIDKEVKDSSHDKSLDEKHEVEHQHNKLLAESPENNDHSVIDQKTLEKYIGCDIKKQNRFFRLFLKTSPQAITSILQAYKERNLDSIEANCHKLKSSSHAIGAITLATICQQLETASISGDWNTIDVAMADLEVAIENINDYIDKKLIQDSADVSGNLKLDNVMLVDDDVFVLDLLTSHLNHLGIHQIITATSGNAALRTLKSLTRPPSALLLDLNMPGMDGVEFLRHLSGQSYSGSIILISAEDTRLLKSAENIARDRNLNILGSLSKPVTTAPLKNLLEHADEVLAIKPSYKQITCTPEELKGALENDEIIVYFQPQISLSNNQLSGVEALVRWEHPTRGMIPPDAFIPLAEELGLINEMTDIIMDKAMKQCAGWRDNGIETKLSINISVDSLDRLDLPEKIVSCVEKHKLNVSNIILEITESRLMQDITSALDILTRLSLKGMGLSIDDFGTGYSSMEQLQRIPFKELKIDRSFVNGAVHNEASRAIIQSSVELAQKLNMSIVAEGVESVEDLEFVAGLGCTIAQGYFISKPIPGDEFVVWYKSWSDSIKTTDVSSKQPIDIPAVKQANG